jgi:phosphatidylethanolamine-binding protein (PEBP) family uncharacterized protein
MHSPALGPGNKIPVKFTRKGGNVSPPLRWGEGPRGTRELVLLCEARDAPWKTPPVYRLVYDISPRKRYLREGSADGCALGLNSWGLARYAGPGHPASHGRRHRFSLYALLRRLRLRPPVIRETVHQAMHGHGLAQAELVAVFRE